MANSKFYSSDLNTYFYLFEKGYQSEVISDSDLIWQRSLSYIRRSGYSSHKKDLNIHFSGMALSDLQLRKEGFDLVIKANDSDEKITLQNYYLIQDKLEFDWKTSMQPPAVTIQGHNLTELTSRIENLEGDRYIHGTNASDLLIGGFGDNVIFGWNGDDKIYGFNGNNILYGGGGDDHLYGGNGNDRLYGGDGTDNLYGGRGNDYLYGEDGHDKLYGEDGHDELYGRDGDDILYGGNGDDILYGGNGNDTLYGAAPDEDYSDFYNNRDYWPSHDYGSDHLYGGDGNDRLYGGYGSDYLAGGNGNDTLHGGYGSDTLHGGFGNDTLHGGFGNDTLYGDDGDDALYGHDGDDTLYGGDGDDTYFFFPGYGQFVGHGQDVVVEYSAGNDKLVFNGANSSEAVFSRSGTDLVVQAYGNTYGNEEQVSLQDYFGHAENYRYMTFEFADTTVTANEASALIA